jgi:hypothetical protein
MLLTILESIKALAINLPMNLNLALILFTIAALAFRASGAGNSPQTECVYSIPVSSPGIRGKKIYIINFYFH